MYFFHFLFDKNQVYDKNELLDRKSQDLMGMVLNNLLHDHGLDNISILYCVMIWDAEI